MDARKEVFMNHFIAADHARCTGCKTCETVCSLYHFGECNPSISAIRVIRRERNGLVFCLPLVCRQCERPACVEACPAEALSRDRERGVLTLNKDECTACGLCVEACPVGCISLDAERKVILCDLCDGQPQCVAFCHARCLSQMSSSESEERRDLEYLVSILEREGLQDEVRAGRKG